MFIESKFTNEPFHMKSQAERICAGEQLLVVGTHALLSKKISYPNLGLLVIDEEQRSYTLELTPYTLHPTPYTLHPTPFTLLLLFITLEPRVG